MSDPNWISSFLGDENSSYLNHLAITMSQIDDSWEQDEIRIEDAEPLPFIDYNLAQNIITVLGNKVDQQDQRAWAYMIQARKVYYQAHQNFQYHFNGLQDAKAYDTILRTKRKKLVDMGDEKDRLSWEKLEWTEINMRKNEKDMEGCLQKVRDHWQVRKHMTYQLSRLKTKFVETVLPRIIESGEKAYKDAHPDSSLGTKPTSTTANPPPTPTPLNPNVIVEPKSEDPNDTVIPPADDPMETDETQNQPDTSVGGDIQKASSAIMEATEAVKQAMGQASDPPKVNSFHESFEPDVVDKWWL